MKKYKTKNCNKILPQILTFIPKSTVGYEIQITQKYSTYFELEALNQQQHVDVSTTDVVEIGRGVSILSVGNSPAAIISMKRIRLMIQVTSCVRVYLTVGGRVGVPAPLYLTETKRYCMYDMTNNCFSL